MRARRRRSSEDSGHIYSRCAKKLSPALKLPGIGAGDGNRTLIVSLGSCFEAFDIIDLFREIVVCQCLGRSWRFPSVRRNSQHVCQIVPSVRAVRRALKGVQEPSRSCPPRQPLKRFRAEFVDEEQKGSRCRGWFLAALLPIRNQAMRHAGRGRESHLSQTEA
jgi:hypothetical protein